MWRTTNNLDVFIEFAAPENRSFVQSDGFYYTRILVRTVCVHVWTMMMMQYISSLNVKYKIHKSATLSQTSTHIAHICILLYGPSLLLDDGRRF